jgi:hypothetical protein
MSDHEQQGESGTNHGYEKRAVAACKDIPTFDGQEAAWFDWFFMISNGVLLVVGRWLEAFCAADTKDEDLDDLEGTSADARDKKRAADVVYGTLTKKLTNRALNVCQAAERERKTGVHRLRCLFLKLHDVFKTSSHNMRLAAVRQLFMETFSKKKYGDFEAFKASKEHIYHTKLNGKIEEDEILMLSVVMCAQTSYKSVITPLLVGKDVEYNHICSTLMEHDRSLAAEGRELVSNGYQARGSRAGNKSNHKCHACGLRGHAQWECRNAGALAAFKAGQNREWQEQQRGGALLTQNNPPPPPPAVDADGDAVMADDAEKIAENAFRAGIAKGKKKGKGKKGEQSQNGGKGSGGGKGGKKPNFHKQQFNKKGDNKRWVQKSGW